MRRRARRPSRPGSPAKPGPSADRATDARRGVSASAVALVVFSRWRARAPAARPGWRHGDGESAADRASPARAVERKGSGIKLREGQAAVGQIRC